ncbi:MAG TPA: hypothetical protein VK698_37880 [Kofleriaceae bacterium]|nr:hypothetical protein [Kofleriaceae bacterium]
MTTSDLYLVVGESAAPARRDQAAEIGRALADAGVAAELAAADQVPAGAPRLVWADELDDLLAVLGEDEREGWLDSTIALHHGADPGHAVEQLEERGLLGAIELGDASAWGADWSGLIVRKDVVRRRGEPVAEPAIDPADDAIDAALDSEAYTRWDDPSAASLADALGRYLGHWREVDAELVVAAEEAMARKLAPVELRVRLGGTGLFRVPPAHSPGYYVVLSSAPGGGAGFAARPAVDDGGPDQLEQTARRMLQNPRGPELVAAVGVETVRLAGASHQAICLHADWLRFRTASCVVRVEHARGVLMAIFICSIGAPLPTSAAVLADPSLRRIARTLRVVDGKPGPED